MAVKRTPPAAKSAGTTSQMAIKQPPTTPMGLEGRVVELNNHYHGHKTSPLLYSPWNMVDRVDLLPKWPEKRSPPKSFNYPFRI